MSSERNTVTDMLFQAGTEHEGKYTGEVENGERSGQGKFKWTSKERNGNVYEGEWYTNKTEGDGTYVWT